MSYKAEVQTYGESSWASNTLRFHTADEAQAYVRDLACRWFAVELTRVIKSDDPATHRWDAERGLEPLVAQTLVDD